MEDSTEVPRDGDIPDLGVSGVVDCRRSRTGEELDDMTDNMVVVLNDEEQKCDHRPVPKGYVRVVSETGWGIWEDDEVIVRGED